MTNSNHNSMTTRISKSRLLASQVGFIQPWVVVLHSLLWVITVAGFNGALAAEPKIIIKGVKSAIKDNIRAHLGVADETCDSPQWRVQKEFDGATAEIEQAMRPYGYYSPEITKATLKFQDKCWTARFEVNPGKPVVVKEVDIQLSGDAQEDPQFQKLVKTFPLKPGEQLNHGEYKAGKSAFESLAAELGYFNGHFTMHKMLVNPMKHEATIRLYYDSGARHHVGEVRIQQDILKPSFVERFVTLEEGKTYESDLLTELHQSLANSGYFETVQVRPRLDEEQDHRVPIDVLLTPRKRNSYSLGIGVATDTGPQLTAGYENRRVNRQGHRLSSKMQLSPALSEVLVEYIIPLKEPQTEQLRIYGGYKHENTDSFESDAIKVGAGITRNRANKWLETRFIDLDYEKSTVGGEDVEALMLVPGINWSRTLVDNRLRPRRGHQARIEVRGGLEQLLSATSFLQLSTYGKWIRSFSWNGRFIARGEFGSTVVDDFDALPSSYRFFAGGDNSVRGYAYQSLGPLNDLGEVMGGRHLLVASAEYEHPIKGNWSGAVFADVGNAFNNFNDLPDALATGIGVGVRWQSPVGPIRLDIASPLDDEDNDYRIHFSMGVEL